MNKYETLKLLDEVYGYSDLEIALKVNRVRAAIMAAYTIIKQTEPPQTRLYWTTRGAV